ncbi:MAG: hypothetical protein ACOCXH_16370, partial [Cyclobacteriaceae bacterium]
SVKTAVEYKGIKFINLPASGFRPRAFGEQDYYGGPSQGMAVLDIKGVQVSVSFHTVSGEVYQYPESFPAFDPEKYPLWVKYTWELPAHNELLNGGFTAGLQHWHQRFVHHEDENPSNICKVKPGAGKKGSPALYLYTRERGYQIPGQDRLPQEINRVCQVVDFQPGQLPSVAIDFWLEEENYHPEALSSIYFWIEGFSGSLKKLNLVYAPGKIIGGIGGRYSQSNVLYPLSLHLPAAPGKWQKAILNIAEDYKRQASQSLAEAAIDKLAINLGVWTINDGVNQKASVLIDQVQLVSSSEASNVEGKAVSEKDESDIYHTRVNHTAGEHIIAPQNVIWPY